MNSAWLLIRADASVAMGTGHVMRCLALAQAWQDAAGRASFAMLESTPAVQSRLAAESCEVFSLAEAGTVIAGSAEDARETITLARQHQAEWVVVDGYQFGAEYQRRLKSAGYRILFLDDYGHAESYSADVVLNQNLSASESLYENREPHTRLLLGPRYALLRRAFRDLRVRGPRPEGNHVLVIMGGSDPKNLTARVIEALGLLQVEKAKIERLEATVVVGGSNPHLPALRRLGENSPRKITVHNDVSNLPELMAAANVAVSAAGSTVWELCRMGLPSLLIDVAPNQTAVAEAMDRGGYAIHVGNNAVRAEAIAEQLGRLLGSSELRQSLSKRSQQLVDGHGASRVVSQLRGEPWGKAEAGDLRLRRACADDSRLLWEWANDPQVRASSFSSQPIPWETHAAWFAEKINNERSLTLIADDHAGTSIGQIRFDCRSDKANETRLNQNVPDEKSQSAWEVDVSIAPQMRGRGMASRLIRQGVQVFLRAYPHGSIHALVKTANAASIKAFERAGFRRVGEEQIRGNAAIHFVFDPSCV